jgi:hypothetical protein
VRHGVILHTNPYPAVRPVGICVLTTNGTMLIKTNDGNIAAAEGPTPQIIDDRGRKSYRGRWPATLLGLIKKVTGVG